jgi:hypothetical protein
MVQVKNELKQKVEEEKDSCLKRYYAYKPKIYKRIGDMALGKAISVDATDDAETKAQCGFVITLRYDSTKIEGMHTDKRNHGSRSKFHQTGDKWISRFDNPSAFKFNSGANGIPEASWILENYMKGIHTGAPYANDTIDSENTEEHMTRFFDKTLPSIVNDIAVKAMQNAVLNYINK